MSIHHWPEEQRPRERLIKYDAAASDAELLAIFLHTGIAGKSAVDLRRDLTAHFGSLSALFSASLPIFSSLHGLSSAKYAQLQAVLELARRSLTEEMQSSVLLTAPRPVKQYLQLALSGKKHECFIALFLDVKM